MRALQSPLSEEDVRSLELGEMIYLDGTVVTARDSAHMRALRIREEGGDAPLVLSGATIFHCGPIMVKRDGQWTPLSMGPTTSARMNSLTPKMIEEFGIRAIIGKGGMSAEVQEAMAEHGCVYLAATGGAAVSLAEGVRKVVCREWEDLGMAESMWVLEAERLGPLVVAIDANGESLYERVADEVERRTGFRE